MIRLDLGDCKYKSKKGYVYSKKVMSTPVKWLKSL